MFTSLTTPTYRPSRPQCADSRAVPFGGVILFARSILNMCKTPEVFDRLKAGIERVRALSGNAPVLYVVHHCTSSEELVSLLRDLPSEFCLASTEASLPASPVDPNVFVKPFVQSIYEQDTFGGQSCIPYSDFVVHALLVDKCLDTLIEVAGIDQKDRSCLVEVVREEVKLLPGVEHLYDPDIDGDVFPKGSCLHGSSVVEKDDAFGKVYEVLQNQTPPKSFEEEGVMFGGFNTSVLILSMLLTYTFVHCEDFLFGALNTLIYGCPKIWYVVPSSLAPRFKAFLTDTYGPNACYLLFNKNIVPDFSGIDLKDFGIVRFVQPPGYTVYTMPGEILHWTVSTGFSLATASNFFVRWRCGLSLDGCRSKWNILTAEAKAEKARRQVINKQAVDALVKYSVL